MLTRRRFVAAAAATAAGGAAGATLLSLRKGDAEYERVAQQTWRHAQGSATPPSDRMLELVRYATLAPSSHNTQCWKFRIFEGSISIVPDFQRRCPAVDPSDHHLFVSLGCAAENLIQAAAAMGLRGAADFQAGPDESVKISLAPTRPVSSPLFEAITSRQSTRAEYDGRPLANEELRLLEAAGTGDGVQIHLLTSKQSMERTLDFAIQGNTAQMRDPAFVRELKQWLRFNGSDAVRSRDGLFSICSGNPSAPSWIGNLMFSAFFTEKPENDKYARHIRSSAGIAVFAAEKDDKAHWVEVGRAFQRFALQATALDVRTAHLNQPVEVASLSPQFANSIGITTGKPDLVVRFGRGPVMPQSLRRPIEAVLL